MAIFALLTKINEYVTRIYEICLHGLRQQVQRAGYRVERYVYDRSVPMPAVRRRPHEAGDLRGLVFQESL